MMSSETDTAAANLLDTLLDLLDEVNLVREIDDPIDNATRTFHFEIEIPLSHCAFNRVIAAFIRHIFREGMRLPRDLSESTCLSTAIDLLNCYYRGINSTGYDGALLDAIHNDFESIEQILGQLAEAVKRVEREKYIEGVFTSHINHCDWYIKHALVMIYLQRYSKILPPWLQAIDPARLVESYRDLLITYGSVTDVVSNYCW